MCIRDSLRGELVGINSAIISPAGGNVGIGFAIPVNMARKVMEQIVAKGRVERGRIGISLKDLHPSINKGLNQGAVIAEIAADSPAEKAGLRKGDIVTGADDRPIRTAAQLRNTIGLARVGEDVKLTLLRNGAGRLQAFAYGLLPQNAAELTSYTVYRWECAIRSSVVLGFVGAGGLGQLMDGSLKMFAGGEVLTMLVIFVGLVALADRASAALRRGLG